jgi:small subunit ribosomal protein S6e
MQNIAGKKQYIEKAQEKSVESAKLLAKGMKESKEKHQEQIAKRRRLSLFRAFISESSQNISL